MSDNALIHLFFGCIICIIALGSYFMAFCNIESKFLICCGLLLIASPIISIGISAQTGPSGVEDCIIATLFATFVLIPIGIIMVGGGLLKYFK